MFVCLEGIDGAGKTTQAKLLTRALVNAGYKVIQVADPGTTPLGKSIRELVIDRDEPISPLAQMLLFSSARAELSEFIREQIAQDTIVICDRWILSTLVYQATGNNIDPDFILSIFRHTSVVPDVCFVLDIAPEKAEQRRPPSKDRFESRPIEDKRLMRQAYLDYAATRKDCARNTYVLNADVPETVMHEAVFEIVGQHLTLTTKDYVYADNCAS
jgi:dTMP kinase